MLMVDLGNLLRGSDIEASGQGLGSDSVGRKEKCGPLTPLMVFSVTYPICERAKLDA